MSILPKGRQSDIVLQELESEILIYDLKNHRAFVLNKTCAMVYRACNGKTTFNEIKRRYKFTDDIIFLALDELKKENLLTEEHDYDSPLKGMNRREVIRRIGFTSIVALPVISSLVAPTAAMAQSGCAAPVKPNGCPVGFPTNVVSPSCAAFSDTFKNNICHNLNEFECTSGNAVYNGTCAPSPGGRIQFNCVCAA